MKISPLHPEEVQLFRNRVAVIGLVITIIFSLLASRLWFLQILNGERYADLAKGNRIRLIPQASPRGIIYDRNGIALADNRAAFQLQLVREDTPNLDKTLENLSEALQIPLASLRKKVAEKRSQAPFKPIILDEDLDYKKAVLVETYQEDFPGITIVVQSRRYYPFNKVASHILGYLGIRNEEQEEMLPENKMSSGHMIGQSGIELLSNEDLIGTDGGKQVEVDHVGRELRVFNNPVNPIPGQDVHLTIDIKIQSFLHEVMKGKSGSVIVMNPKTGEVLALESFPNFNPNLFASGIKKKNWTRMMNNPEHPMENKGVQGVYPPGSTFKMVTAYTGLEKKVITPSTTYLCNGYFYVKGRSTPYKCWRWKDGGHGTVDLYKGIKFSCNVYFYHIGMDVGVDALHQYATKFGFGQKTGLNLGQEKIGLIPSEEWKLKTYGERWYAGETPPISIGQGFLTVTPLQVVNFINILANFGHVARPHLMMEETSKLELKNIGLNHEYLRLIREGMMGAANDANGTAKVTKHPEFILAGKTGTAQVVGHKTLNLMEDADKKDKSFQNHAWFAAFGPMDNPEISIAVLIEHGGAGARDAGPVAKAVLHYYIDNYWKPRQQKLDPNAPAKSPSVTFREDLEEAFPSLNDEWTDLERFQQDLDDSARNG